MWQIIGGFRDNIIAYIMRVLKEISAVFFKGLWRGYGAVSAMGISV